MSKLTVLLSLSSNLQCLTTLLRCLTSEKAKFVCLVNSEKVEISDIKGSNLKFSTHNLNLNEKVGRSCVATRFNSFLFFPLS